MRDRVKVSVVLGIATVFALINYILFLRGSLDENNDRKNYLKADHESLEYLHGVVSSTNGFYARDWSLWLGWNNLRYIMGDSILQAQLLNRTLILPTYVYARGCAFHVDSCSAYFDVVNRIEAMGNHWEDTPLEGEQQLGWRVPLSHMIDLPLLRERHPVILVSEYLRLHGLSEALERQDGYWDQDAYHSGSYIPGTEQWYQSKGLPSLFVIKNDWYENEPVVRVDSIPDAMKKRGSWRETTLDTTTGKVGEWGPVLRTPMYKDLNRRGRLVDFDNAKTILEHGGQKVDTDEDVQRSLNDIGWEVLHTYGQFNHPMRSVVNKERVVASRSNIRGFKDDFAAITEDVVLLKGEVHGIRPPGSLRFTSEEGRDSFTRMTLQDIVPAPNIYKLAKALDERMSEKVNGRLWRGAHMRRGDFATLGWAAESTAEGYLERIKNNMRNGRDAILEVQNDKRVVTFDVPDATPDMGILSGEAPLEGDVFYLATDDQSPESVRYIKENGGVLLNDLLTPEERRDFGPGLLITDIQGVVEQALLARGGYFWGHILSSFVGGIVNMRASHADRRTTTAD